MLFYAVFAVALWLRAPILAVLVPVFGALSILAIIRTDAWPAVTILANLLVLEFVFGVCVAMIILRGFRLPLGVAVPVIVVGFVLLFTIGVGPTIGAAHIYYRQTLRVLVWGLPAAAIVLCACASEVRLRTFLPGWVLVLGDASYSIYLIHSFVLAAVGSIVVKLHVASQNIALALIILIGMVASALTGIVTYRFIERPLVESLRARERQRA
jgi:peptidoglycan/LPS O-acetylase OafA/YrhL